MKARLKTSLAHPGGTEAHPKPWSAKAGDEVDTKDAECPLSDADLARMVGMGQAEPVGKWPKDAFKVPEVEVSQPETSRRETRPGRAPTLPLDNGDNGDDETGEED